MSMVTRLMIKDMALAMRLHSGSSAHRKGRAFVQCRPSFSPTRFLPYPGCFHRELVCARFVTTRSSGRKFQKCVLNVPPTRSLVANSELCRESSQDSAPLLEKETESSSPDALLAYVRQKAKTGAVRKLVTALQESESGTGAWGEAGLLPDGNVYRIGIRSLLSNQRTDLATEMYRLRMKAREERPESLHADFGLAASVIRAVLRDCKKRKLRALDSLDVFEDMRKDCALPENEGKVATDIDNGATQKKVSALLHVMNSFLTDGDRERASQALDSIRKLRVQGSHAAIAVEEYNNAIRVLGKSRLVEEVFIILDLMRSSCVKPDNETFEFLANAAVRQVEFLTGAVSMETLPSPLGAEIAFVGRSNVGKSSLVNMLCNRKALAYVSGRPGKTQQFNYFLVNGEEKESQFYLVDLPGVGYAKVPRGVQNEWMNFMGQYLQLRTSLRLVFHLVDGRHGALEDDEALMGEVARSGRMRSEYVVVLTKMDKMDKQKAKRSILDKTRAALIRNGCLADTPIILTSASTRLGRDELWRYLQAALTHSFDYVSRRK